MKKIVWSICLSLFGTCLLNAQTTSTVNKLATLTKVWGLLKYYHPTIASGQYNWDSVFILSCKQVMAPGNRSIEPVINNLLAIAGPDTATWSVPATGLPPICYKNYDLSWIGRLDLLSRKQQKTLQFIATHPYSGLSYYAPPDTRNDSTVHTPNEDRYPEMQHPDVYYRLLGLGRFWNVVEYYYPYKYKIGQPWDKVLDELIPIMMQANDTLSWHKAISRMAASLHDSHAGLWPQVHASIAGKYSMPFNFRLVAGKAVITAIPDSTVSLAAGLAAGYVVETMDGVAIAQKIKDYWDYAGGSNEGATLRDMHAFVLNSHNRQSVLGGYQPDGKRFTLTVTLTERNFIKEYSSFMGTKSSTPFYITADSVGYVFFAHFRNKNMDSIMQQMMPTQALIFDMRGYPDGYAPYYIPEFLLSRPVIYARNTSPDFRWPGMMRYVESNQGTSFAMVGKNNPHPYKGRIILLVDERTQSQGEWACMTLQTAPNVIVIGHQTAGADGNVTRTVLPGGYNISFSGLGIYYPDGRETQRTGIPVDIPVNYTIEDYMYKKDPVLQRALTFIRTGK